MHSNAQSSIQNNTDHDEELLQSSAQQITNDSAQTSSAHSQQNVTIPNQSVFHLPFLTTENSANLESFPQAASLPNDVTLNLAALAIPITNNACVQQNSYLDESSNSSAESYAPHASNTNRTAIARNNTSHNRCIINCPGYHHPSQYLQHSLRNNSSLPP